MAISENSVPLFYATIDKVAEEEDKLEFDVVASTDALDKDGEIIDPAAIRKMKSVQRVPYCVASDHREARINPLTQVGWAYPIPDTPDNVFKAHVELWADYPRAKEYWLVLRKTWQEQKVSIGGELAKPKTVEWKDGRRVRRIHDIDLDHILAVRGSAAANPETAVELDMRKALFKTADELYGEDEADKEWHGMSAETIRDKIIEQMLQKFPAAKNAWIEELYENGAVVEVNTGDGAYSYYWVSYSVSADGEANISEPVQVRRAWRDEHGNLIAGEKTVALIDRARGEGQGVGGPRQGDGGTDTCVCPNCGYEMPHERGTPCNELTCPECGTAMVGKSEAEDMWDELDEAQELLDEGKEFVPFDDELEKAAANVSLKPWRKTGYAKKLPASCFLYVPDPKKRSTWKFPVFEGEDMDPKTGRYRKRGKLNWNALRNAAARLAAIINRIKQGRGFKSMSLAEARKMVAVVKKKIAALYRRIGKPLPDVLKKTTEVGDERMSVVQQLLKVVSDLLGKDGVEAEDAIEEAAEAIEEEAATTEEAENTEAAAEEEVQEEKTEDKASDDIDARFKALEEQIAALRQVVEQMASEEKTEDAAEEDKTEEAVEEASEETADEAESETSDEPAADDEAEKADDTAAIAAALREALQPIVERIEGLEESVKKVAKARGISLQVDKAEPQADDAEEEDGSLMAFELALRQFTGRDSS